MDKNDRWIMLVILAIVALCIWGLVASGRKDAAFYKDKNNWHPVDLHCGGEIIHTMKLQGNDRFKTYASFDNDINFDTGRT